MIKEICALASNADSSRKTVKLCADIKAYYSLYPYWQFENDGRAIGTTQDNITKWINHAESTGLFNKSEAESAVSMLLAYFDDYTR